MSLGSLLGSSALVCLELSLSKLLYNQLKADHQVNISLCIQTNLEKCRSSNFFEIIFESIFSGKVQKSFAAEELGTLIKRD